MSDISDFADQLQMDVVADMADSFFGSRKEVDNALEAFEGMVRELLPVIEHLYRAAATLRMLLLDDETVDAFCAALGLDSSAVLPAEGASILTREGLPFALTGKGRYAACVIEAYVGLLRATDEYIHGHYFNDPARPGRKRLTMHYRRLKEVAGIINEKIRKANTDRSVTSVLREVRSLDPVKMEREELLGDVNFQGGCALDRDMCFVPIDFDGYHFPEVAELPHLDTIQSALRRFCAQVWEAREDDARRAMSVFKGEGTAA